MSEWDDKYAAGIVHVDRLFGEIGIEGRIELPKIVGTCNGCLVVVKAKCPACEDDVLGALEWSKYELEEVTVADIEQCRLDAIHRHLNDGCDGDRATFSRADAKHIQGLLKRIREACPSAQINSVSRVEGHPELVSVGITPNEFVPLVEDLVPPIIHPDMPAALAGDVEPTRPDGFYQGKDR